MNFRIVPPQVFCSTNRLLSFWASVHIFSAMGEHMLIQVSSRTKWLLALNTIKYPFPVVGLHTPLQNFWSTKWLLASCTIVYFLSSVGGVAFFWCWLVTISVNWVDSYSRTCRHCTKTLWSLINCIFPLSFFFTYYGPLYFIIQGVSYLPNNKL